MKCVACRLGFSWECRDQGKCDHGSAEPVVSDSDLGPDHLGGDQSDSETQTPVNDPWATPEAETDPDPDSFRTYKDDSSLRDQQSTGRKRAAKMYPLDETKLCEWASQKNCGGGKHPIVGCFNNLQAARHHGSDKNTLNNEKGNVHRICHNCHNRWHTLNDPDYVWADVHEIHSPMPASVEEIMANEEMWKDRKVVKAKD